MNFTDFNESLITTRSTDYYIVISALPRNYFRFNEQTVEMLSEDQTLEQRRWEEKLCTLPVVLGIITHHVNSRKQHYHTITKHGFFEVTAMKTFNVSRKPIQRDPHVFKCTLNV